MQSFKPAPPVAPHVPPDAAFDLEGGPPAPRPAPAAAPATSAITQERAGSGKVSWGFLAGAAALAALAGGLAYGLGLDGGATPLETAAAPLTFGLADEDLATGRLVSALAAAATAFAIAVAGRSLTRSGIAGLLAGALLALDPALLGYGRLATPIAPTLAFLAIALACFAASRPWVAWAGTCALFLAAFLDPRALAWGPVLAVFTLLRGHIYASPRHLGLALAQAVLVPAAGVILHVAADGMLASVPACLAPGWLAMLDLQALVAPGPGLVLLPNPVTWFAGLGAILFLGLGGLGFGATRFRLARANGRLQARLVAPFPAVLGRGVWLLLLAAALPLPQAWALLAVLALALGVQNLGEDAPGFGLTLAIAALLFAAVVLVRAWAALHGDGDATGAANAMDLVPWSKPALCT